MVSVYVPYVSVSVSVSGIRKVEDTHQPVGGGCQSLLSVWEGYPLRKIILGNLLRICMVTRN